MPKKCQRQEKAGSAFKEEQELQLSIFHIIAMCSDVKKKIHLRCIYQGNGKKKIRFLLPLEIMLMYLGFHYEQNKQNKETGESLSNLHQVVFI